MHLAPGEPCIGATLACFQLDWLFPVPLSSHLCCSVLLTRGRCQLLTCHDVEPIALCGAGTVIEVAQGRVRPVQSAGRALRLGTQSARPLLGPQDPPCRLASLGHHRAITRLACCRLQVQVVTGAGALHAATSTCLTQADPSIRPHVLGELLCFTLTNSSTLAPCRLCQDPVGFSHTIY